MKLFEKCPVCGGEVVEKEVEKPLRGGKNTAVVRVTAEVCQHIGGGKWADLFEKLESDG